MKIQTTNTLAARILNALRRDRRGNVWVEYLILVALLGLAGVGAVQGLSGNFGKGFGDVGKGVQNLSSGYKPGN